MEDRVVLKVDQVESENQDHSRHLGECSTDSDLDYPVRVPSPGLSGIPVKDLSINAADFAVITTEYVRTTFKDY